MQDQFTINNLKYQKLLIDRSKFVYDPMFVIVPGNENIILKVILQENNNWMSKHRENKKKILPQNLQQVSLTNLYKMIRVAGSLHHFSL